MEPVPAFDSQGVAAQLVVAGHAPHVGWNLVLFGQNPLGAQSLVEHRAAAPEMRFRFVVSGFQLVDAFDDALLRAFGHRRFGGGFFFEGGVIENSPLPPINPPPTPPYVYGRTPCATP